MKLSTLSACAVALAVGLASAANAKDVCATDGDGREYRFENPKLPKKPGKVAPILGAARLVPQAVDPFSYGPIQGSAMQLIGQDVVIVSVFGQTQNIPFSVRAVVDRDFAGQGFGAFGPGAGLDTAITWTPVDCDAITLP
jgi:hypothetical protein